MIPASRWDEESRTSRGTTTGTSSPVSHLPPFNRSPRVRSNVLQEMNSLGIKRGEGSRQFGELLLLVIPHLISLSILMIWGVWDKSPFSTPLMEPIHPFLGALIVSPFIIFSLIAYVVFASIFLIVFRLTATRMSTVKRNVLTAFLSGISVFGILTQYWSHIP